MAAAKNDVITLAGGDITVAVDEGAAIHLKVVTPHGDPVELNADEVRELVRQLTRLVPRIE